MSEINARVLVRGHERKPQDCLGTSFSSTLDGVQGFRVGRHVAEQPLGTS